MCWSFQSLADHIHTPGDLPSNVSSVIGMLSSRRLMREARSFSQTSGLSGNIRLSFAKTSSSSDTVIWQQHQTKNYHSSTVRNLRAEQLCLDFMKNDDVKQKLIILTSRLNYLTLGMLNSFFPKFELLNCIQTLFRPTVVFHYLVYGASQLYWGTTHHCERWLLNDSCGI